MSLLSSSLASVARSVDTLFPRLSATSLSETSPSSFTALMTAASNSESFFGSTIPLERIPSGVSSKFQTWLTNRGTLDRTNTPGLGESRSPMLSPWIRGTHGVTTRAIPSVQPIEVARSSLSSAMDVLEPSPFESRLRYKKGQTLRVSSRVISRYKPTV